MDRVPSGIISRSRNPNMKLVRGIHQWSITNKDILIISFVFQTVVWLLWCFRLLKCYTGTENSGYIILGMYSLCRLALVHDESMVNGKLPTFTFQPGQKLLQ